MIDLPAANKDCAYWASLDPVIDLPAAIGDCFCCVWHGWQWDWWEGRHLFKQIVADARRSMTGETPLHLWSSARPAVINVAQSSDASRASALLLADPAYAKQDLEGVAFGDPMDVLEAILALPDLDVNAVDKQGWTALHALAAHADVDAGAAKRLLDAGVDPSIRDVFGRTALNLLRERGCDNADAEPMEAIAHLEAAELRITANAVAPSAGSRTRSRL